MNFILESYEILMKASSCGPWNKSTKLGEFICSLSSIHMSSHSGFLTSFRWPLSDRDYELSRRLPSGH